VITYYGRLKKLSVDCKFGEFLEAVLLDKFVTGLRPGQVLDRLCEENESLTLQQAVDIAINKECALKEIIGITEPAYHPPQPAYNRYGSECEYRPRGGGRRGGYKGKKPAAAEENWRNQANEGEQ
jgi:hypothetical protein